LPFEHQREKRFASSVDAEVVGYRAPNGKRLLRTSRSSKLSRKTGPSGLVEILRGESLDGAR
jgi:hypothetical protein